MAAAPDPQSTLPAVSRRGVVRTALWSAPAITLATAAPAWAVSTTRLVQFEAPSYQWSYREDGDLSPYALVRVNYTIAPDESGPSPAVEVHFTFPPEWTGAVDGDVVTVEGPYGAWTPSIAPDASGRIRVTEALHFTHLGGLQAGEGYEQSSELSFIAFVEGRDLTISTDPITLLYLVDPSATGWEVAPDASPAVFYGSPVE